MKEIRPNNRGDIARVIELLPEWITAEAVKYLERNYDDTPYVVSEELGSDAGWTPGLFRTYWHLSWDSLHIQPMFTLKIDADAPLYTCSICQDPKTRHRCWDCGRWITHMAEGDCINCFEAELKAIARRPPEMDPQ